jgi:hypothetical protein
MGLTIEAPDEMKRIILAISGGGFSEENRIYNVSEL